MAPADGDAPRALAAVPATRRRGTPERRPQLCAARIKARRLAATLCADEQAAQQASGAAHTSDTDIQHAWALKSHHSVGDLLDPDTGKAVALGDVLALPNKAMARGILLRALAALEDGDGPTASECLGDLVIEAGEATAMLRRDRLDDGRENNYPAHREHFARLATTATRGYLAADRRCKGGCR